MVEPVKLVTPRQRYQEDIVKVLENALNDARAGKIMSVYVITTEVGQHQMWAAQFYRFDKPRRWINSGGLGTMGFGLPAAMGAVLAWKAEAAKVPALEAKLAEGSGTPALLS